MNKSKGFDKHSGLIANLQRQNENLRAEKRKLEALIKSMSGKQSAAQSEDQLKQDGISTVFPFLNPLHENALENLH